MARAPKTNTTATENTEGTAPEGENPAPDQGNEGAEGTGSDGSVKDPDGNTPDPNQPAPEGNGDGPDPKVAELEGVVQSLSTKLDQANVELSKRDAAEKKAAEDLDAANSKIDELTKQIDELLEAGPQEGQTDTGATDGRNRVARGYLLGVVMAMPENYRLNGLGAKLDELEQFVGEFEGDDRYVAVELIKEIAKARPNDIPSGRYINDVRRAFAVLDGENEASIDAVQIRDEQNAAYNRLAGVVGASPVPAGFVADRRERSEQPAPVLDGTDEQNAAASRFQNAAG